jgi:hypothetical protein
MADKTGPKSITEEEYCRWLTPKAALERVGNATSWDTAAKSILRRAASGKIRIHAEDIRFVRSASDKGAFYRFSPVPDTVINLWAESSRPSSWPFWKDGEAEIETGSSHSMQNRATDWQIFGIRFDPAGIDDLIGVTPPIPTGTGTPEPRLPAVGVAKPVSKGELDRWAQVFVGVHKDFTGDFAQRSAAAMFPDKTVGRDRAAKAISDIIGPRTRGPKKTIR